MDRRAFLKGLVATAAGVLVPGQVLAAPERRVWALDRTMMVPQYNYLQTTRIDLASYGAFDRLPVTFVFEDQVGNVRRLESERIGANSWQARTPAGGPWRLAGYDMLVVPTDPSAFTVTIASA